MYAVFARYRNRNRRFLAGVFEGWARATQHSSVMQGKGYLDVEVTGIEVPSYPLYVIETDTFEFFDRDGVQTYLKGIQRDLDQEASADLGFDYGTLFVVEGDWSPPEPLMGLLPHTHLEGPVLDLIEKGGIDLILDT